MSQSGLGCLFAAARGGHVGVVWLLLDNKANVNAADPVPCVQPTAEHETANKHSCTPPCHGLTVHSTTYLLHYIPHDLLSKSLQGRLGF
jgi:hypothetical protein